MWIVFLVLLVLLLLTLIAYIISLNMGLKKAAQQIEAHIHDETITRLDVSCPNGAADELLKEVNKLAECRQQEKTEWVRREQGLRQQIANVSHDLRTPLTSILGYLQLLESPELPEEKRKEYLNVIEGRARTLQSFIASFYELSRIEGGEFPLERERVDLLRALSDLLADSYEQLEQSGLSVETEFCPSLPPVWADRGAVTRVFSNLLTNALRHGKGILRIRLYRTGDTVVSSFSNPAPSMTAEDAPRVFERFYSADKARDRDNTGLGLAIVKALADRMGCTAQAAWEDGIFTVSVFWKV